MLICLTFHEISNLFFLIHCNVLTYYCIERKNLPCLTDTYLAFDAATKLACGSESSKENISSLVTVGDLVFKTDLEPIGAK